MYNILEKVKKNTYDFECNNNGRYPNLLLLGHHEFHELNKKITFPNREFPVLNGMHVIRVFTDHCLEVGYIMVREAEVDKAELFWNRRIKNNGKTR